MENGSSLVLKPVNLHEDKAIVPGGQYILAEVKDNPLHIEVMLFTATSVIVESFGDKGVSRYWKIAVSPRDGSDSYEKTVRVGHWSSERSEDSVFFFEFSSERLADLDLILLADDPVADFYKAIGRTVPGWLREHTEPSHRPRFHVSGGGGSKESFLPREEVKYGRDF